MSRPTRGHRRVGFPLDIYGRPRSKARSGDWSQSVRREARWAYLQVLAHTNPNVLESLPPPGDETALTAWVHQWGLMSTDPADEWGLAHARATQRNLKQYQPRKRCWFDRDDVAGVQCYGTHPLESRPLRDAEHFKWLARFQCGAPWGRVTSTAADLKTVRGAVAALADRLGLQLRPTRRGRPATSR
jgi:hypothetical protein